MNLFPRATLMALADATFPGDRDEIQETRDFRAVFLGTEAGRRVLATVAHRCGWLNAVAPSNATNDTPYLAAFNEGRRSTVEMIARIIDRELRPHQEVDHGGSDDLDTGPGGS